MSANLSDNSCAVYAVVDKKRKVCKDKQECSTDSANFALYSVIDKSSSAGVESPNGNDPYDDERSKNHSGKNGGNISSIYSVLGRKNKPETPVMNNKPFIYEKKEGAKKFKKILFTLFVVLFLLLLITAFIVAVFSSYEISSLKTKITLIEASLPISNSPLYFNESVEILQSQFDNITTNIWQLSANIESKIVHIRETSNMTLNSLDILDSITQELSSNLSSIMMSNMELKAMLNGLNDSFESSINITRSELQNKLNVLEYRYLLLTELTDSIINSEPFASSCKDILMNHYSIPSGYYWLSLSNGSRAKVYCEMKMSCDGITGGWMRVAKLNKLTNGSAQCFQNLTRYRSNDAQCVRNSSIAGCSKIFFPVLNVQYSHICGTIQGYGLNTPDGFQHSDINGRYVDGISLTYNGPGRNHIWTFAAKARSRKTISCVVNKPGFVEENYACLSLITDKTCPSNTNCSPMFSRQLEPPTSADIEMRVCLNQMSSDENILLDNVDIYVQ